MLFLKSRLEPKSRRYRYGGVRCRSRRMNMVRFAMFAIVLGRVGLQLREIDTRDRSPCGFWISLIDLVRPA